MSKKKNLTSPAAADPKPQIIVDPETGERDVSGAGALFVSLQGSLTAAGSVPSAGMVKELGALCDGERAMAAGRGIASDRVLADEMVELAAHVPHLLQGGYPGFGPKRAHYALSIAIRHAAEHNAFVAVEAKRAGASQAKSTSVHDARNERSAVHGLLGELAHTDSTLKASLTKAAQSGAKRPAQVASGLAALAGVGDDVLAKAKKNAGRSEMLDDMGITAAVITSAKKAGERITSTTSVHNAERTTHGEESDTLNLLDGQAMFELDALARAVDRARAAGRNVPEVKLANIGRVHHRAAAPLTPEPVPQP